MANRIIKPIDDLITHLLGKTPYDRIGTLKLWEALKVLSDGLFKKGAITTKQVADSTVLTGGTLEDTLGALVAGSLLKYAARFATDIVFSSTDYNTVAWTAGTIRFDDGSVATILAGNTGNMTGLTYIVYHPDADPTALQVYTSYTDVAGNNDDRILMCVAKPAAFDATNPQDAFYIPAIGTFGINETVIGANSISTSKIQALAITTGRIDAGAVTAAKISVAQLSAISVDAGTLTTGTLTGLLIRTASSGQRVEINSTDGLKGIDSSGNILTQLTTAGVLTLKTAASGARIELDTTNGLRVYDSGGNLIGQLGLAGAITIQALDPIVTSTQMLLGTATDNSGSTKLQAGNTVASGLAFVQVVGGANGTGRVNFGSQQTTRGFIDNTGLTIGGVNIISAAGVISAVPDAALTSNVPLKNAVNSFGAQNTFSAIKLPHYSSLANFKTGIAAGEHATYAEGGVIYFGYYDGGSYWGVACGVV